MKKINYRDMIPSSPEGTKGVDFRPLIAENMGAPHFYMRLFQISPDGHTPRHTHDWEHEIFVIEGNGKVVLADREEELEPGDALLIEPNELHQFVNSGDVIFKLICVIPKPAID